VGKDAEKTTAGQATVYRTGLNVTGSAVNDTAGKTATVTANGLTANGDTTGDKIATVTSEGMTVQADAARKKTATYDVSGVALQDTDSSKTNTVSVDGMNIQNGTSGAALTTTNLQLGMTNGTGGINLGNQAGGGANTAEGNYLTGLSNTAWDAKNIASGRAATEDQLKAVSDSISASTSDYQLVANPDTTDGKYTVSNGKVDLKVKDSVHSDAEAKTVTIEGIASQADVNAKTFGLTDDAGTAVTKTLDNTIQVKGGISDTSKLTTTDNIGVVANGTDGLKVRLAKDLKGLDSVTTGNTVINNSGLTITNNGKTVSLTDGGLNNGGNKITNVGKGDVSDTSTDAVNGSQLQEVKTLAGKHTKVTVEGGTEAGTTDYAGTNLKLKATTTDGQTTYDLKLGDDITVGQKGENGKDGSIGVNGKDGSSVVINGKDGSIGLNGKDGANGLTIKGADGSVGVDGTDGHDGKDGMTRIVYEDHNKVTHEVATLDDGLKFKGDDDTVIAKKLNTQLDITGGADKSKLTSKDNIGVNSTADGKLKVQLAKNLDLDADGSVTTGNTVVNNSGLTITNNGKTVSLTDGGLDNGGNKITNVANGENDTDAVNYSQLKQVDQKAGKHTVVTVEGGTTAGTDTYNGSSLKLKATTTDGQTTYDLKLGDNLSIGGKNGADGKDGHIGVNGKDGVSGVGIDGKDGISIKGKDGKDGVTIKGIDGVDGVDGAEGHIGLNGKDGMTDIWTKPGEPGLNGKDGETMTRIVYKDPKGNTHEAATLDDGLKFKGDDNTVIAKKLNTQMDITGGADKSKLTSKDNIGVNSTADGKLKVQLAKNLDLDADGSVTTGNTTINNGGITITSSGKTVSLTDGGLNNGGNKIANVANGENDTDAVNVAQLKKLQDTLTSSKIHYYSVKSTQTEAGSNYENDGAVGENSLAAGSYALAQTDSVSVGHEAQANDTRSVAIGTGAQTFSKADSQDAADAAGGNTAIGYHAQAGRTDEYGLATAVGKDTTATGWGSSAYGVSAEATGSWATAIGNHSSGTGEGSTVVGATATANEAYATAIGLGAKATAVWSLAAGYQTQAQGLSSVAIGAQAKATQAYSVVLGNGSTDRAATQETQGTIPLSDGSTRTYGNFAGSNPFGVVSIGTKNKERQIVNVAAGKISADSTDAVNGSQLYSLAHEVGTNASDINQIKTDITNVTAEAGKHTALTVDGQAPINTTYVGDNLKLNVTDNDGQKTYDLKLNDTLRIGGKDGQDGHMGINGADGKSGVGIDGKDGISIKGKDGKESVTIKGIDGVDGVDGAEGHIGLNGKDGMTDIWTKPGTPGLNGKDGETMTRIVYKDPQGQEHQAATLDDGLKFGGDSGTASAVKLNKQLNVTGGETDSSKLATGNNLGVVSSQDGENGKLEIKLAKDLTGLNSVTTGNTVVNNDGLTISSSAAGVTKTVKLGNQAGGGANAAEGNYLTGLDNKTWDAKNIASGRAATEDQLKVVAESIGTDVSGKTFGLADDANATVSKTLGNTIQVKGDSKAISTSVDGDALKISLNDNITLGGKDGANGKDGHIGVDGKDGKDGADGYNGKDAVSIDGKDGNEGHIGLNGKDGKDGERGQDGKNAYSDISTHFGPASLNDAANVTMTDGTTKMTRLRYEDQNGYTHEVATMDDGQVYGGDTGTAFKRYLNQQANVKGGITDESKLTTTDNIGVVSDGTDTLKVRLAKDLKGLDSVTTGNTVVNNDGITINNKVSLTDGGLNNGGNKITNVGNGENDTDAVNYSQLKQVDQKAGKHTVVTVEGGTVAGTDTYAGSSLKLKATTTDGQTTYDLKLGDNLSIGGKDGADGKDGHIGVNGADGKSGVGIDGKDGISIKGKDGKDGVTIKGIDGVDGVDGAEGHIGLNGKDGMTDIWTKPGAPGLNGKDGETMTRIVYKDPKGNTHEAATLDDGLKFGGDFGDASAVKLNKQVNVKGNARNEADLTDGNIGVVSSQDGANGQLLIKLNKDLDLTEQGSVKLGSVSLSGSGLNNGGQQITNVASGTSGKTWDATTQGYEATWNNGANIGDVKTAINDIKGADKGGFGLTADDGQSVKQDLGKTITVTGDKNIETKVSDGKLQIGLKKDVDLGPDGSIKTGDTTISKDGVETNKITIKDSSISISKDGIDAGNTVIKDVHSGIVNGDDTDNSNAANIGDVKKIAGDAAEGARAKSGKNITVKDDNTVNLNDKITLGDDTNKAQQVTIDGNGATVTAGDGDNQVKLDGSKGQITAGGATLGKQENTSGDKNPASGSYLTGLDNKTWDGEHIQSGRAATEDQLQVVDKKISGGRVFQGDDGKDNAVTVGLGDTMKLTGGADSANLTNGNIGVVRSSDGDGLEIKLSKNITGLDSVTTGNTTINNSGVTIKSSDSTKGGDIKIATGDVSMGGSQIHDVAPGSNGTDAVNVNQLSSAMNNVERNFTKLDARVNRAGANAAALAALHPLDFDPDDKLDVAAGTGHYNGANAVAIGAFYRPNEDTMISLGGSMGGGENMINAGVTFKLGQHNHVSTTRVAMAKEIKALKALVNQQYGEMQQMKQMVNQLAGKTALSVDTSALFPDIPQNHWAYEYVTKLAHSGILQGYPDGEFKGDRMMTRYEFATMLYRAIMGGAASNPDLNKDGTLDKLTKEFEPELKYIRIDVIQKDQDGVPTIERVRTTEAARYHRAGK
jgi:autotransporter adhesin